MASPPRNIAAQPVAGRAYNRRFRPSPHTTMTSYPQKITFGEMRSSGVRDVLVFCRDHRCSHHVAINADRWPDDVSRTLSLISSAPPAANAARRSGRSSHRPRWARLSKVQSVDQRMRPGMRCRLSSGRAVAHVQGSYLPLPDPRTARQEGVPIRSPQSRSRNNSGIVSPRAFAVLRLITRSNLIGCSTREYRQAWCRAGFCRHTQRCAGTKAV